MSIWIWIVFLVIIGSLVALDLGVFNKRPHEMKAKEALMWTATWVSLAMLFNIFIYFKYEYAWFGTYAVSQGMDGTQAALQFFTGYVVEQSLSIDNVFVIALIFEYFKIPTKHQRRILFWGIVGAVVMRGVMILIGAALIARFEWVMYIFGAILIISAARMLMMESKNLDPEKNLMIRIVKKFYGVSDNIEAGKFFIIENGKKLATPLFFALVMVEGADVLFALDSIPAIFAITRDPFIVFTSNIFSILGLRSLYFVLVSFMSRFKYIKISLVFVLAFIGIKMLLQQHYHIPSFVSLAVILGILLVGTLASLLATSKKMS